MRAHKLTYQAMWEMLAPLITEYLDENNSTLSQQINKAVNEKDYEELATIFVSESFQNVMNAFLNDKCKNPNSALCYSYMELVSILLLFTRAQREGDWNLYLSAFKMMLPYFFYYDHPNYAKWGTIEFAEMHMLPDKLSEEFKEGNFVIKLTDSKFNQVDPDQAQEWLNATGKKSGGMVGITKTFTALNRWGLTFNLRSQISKNTKEMLKVSSNHSVLHKETNMSRRKRDANDETKILLKLKYFGVFSEDTSVQLINIVTKDQATTEITVTS